MAKSIDKKYGDLCNFLKSEGKLAVAFSAGVDSTLLLRAAVDALGSGNVLAVTAVSHSFPERENREAEQFCSDYGVRRVIVEVDQLSIPGFRENPADRCYICKKELFGRMIEAAKENGFDKVAEGSNLDDKSDYRPGAKAVAEMNILSPLQELSFSKQEIRALSRELGLETWQKPAYACLASRFVYGETLTEEKLQMVSRAEQFLIDSGFRQMRVRIHGDIARIELLPEDMDRFFQKEMRESVLKELTDAGFSRVTVDLAGFQSGSMNKGLTLK